MFSTTSSFVGTVDAVRRLSAASLMIAMRRHPVTGTLLVQTSTGGLRLPSGPGLALTTLLLMDVGDSLQPLAPLSNPQLDRITTPLYRHSVIGVGVYLDAVCLKGVCTVNIDQ